MTKRVRHLAAMNRKDIAAFVGLEVEGKHKGLKTLFIQGSAPAYYVFSMISKLARSSSSAHVQNYGVENEVANRYSELQAEYIGVQPAGLSQALTGSGVQQVYFGATYRGKNCSDYSISTVTETCAKMPNAIITLDYDGRNRIPQDYATRYSNLELMVSIQRYASAQTLRNMGWMIEAGIADKVQIKFRGPIVVVLPLSAAIVNNISEINKDILL